MLGRKNGGDTPRCLYGLHKKCLVLKRLLEYIKDENEREKIKGSWGREEWVRLHCGMCVKSMYAKAKYEANKSYKVVNTL